MHLIIVTETYNNKVVEKEEKPLERKKVLKKEKLLKKKEEEKEKQPKREEVKIKMVVLKI